MKVKHLCWYSLDQLYCVLVFISDWFCSFESCAEPSASLIYQVGHKFHEVFQIKPGSYSDLPAAKISEMMKSNSLDVSSWIQPSDTCIQIKKKLCTCVYRYACILCLIHDWFILLPVVAECSHSIAIKCCQWYSWRKRREKKRRNTSCMACKWKYKYISIWVTCTSSSSNPYSFINIVCYFCLFSGWHACWERFHRRSNAAYRHKQNTYELYVRYIVLNIYVILLFSVSFLMSLSYTVFSKVIFLRPGKKNISRE